MLINADDFEAIRSGRVDTAFRRWIRPTVKAGGTLTITAAGALTLQAPSVAIESGTLTHNGINVGDTHVHGGILPGPADTATPH